MLEIEESGVREFEILDMEAGRMSLGSDSKLKIKRVDGAPCYHTGCSRTRLRYQKLSTTATPAPVCPS